MGSAVTGTEFTPVPLGAAESSVHPETRNGPVAVVCGSGRSTTSCMPDWAPANRAGVKRRQSIHAPNQVGPRDTSERQEGFTVTVSFGSRTDGR
jgi:hypothetical protein